MNVDAIILKMISDAQPLIDTVFYAIVSTGIGFLIKYLSRLSESIANLNLELTELNGKIAVVIEKISDHDHRIKRLEKNHDEEE